MAKLWTANNHGDEPALQLCAQRARAKCMQCQAVAEAWVEATECHRRASAVTGASTLAVGSIRERAVNRAEL